MEFSEPEWLEWRVFLSRYRIQGSCLFRYKTDVLRVTVGGHPSAYDAKFAVNCEHMPLHDSSWVRWPKSRRAGADNS